MRQYPDAILLYNYYTKYKGKKMKKIILTTTAVLVLGTTTLFAQTVSEDNLEKYPLTTKMVLSQKSMPTPTLEDNYEQYSKNGNKVKFSDTKELTDIYDLSKSKSAIYEEKSVSIPTHYDSKSDIYN